METTVRTQMIPTSTCQWCKSPTAMRRSTVAGWACSYRPRSAGNTPPEPAASIRSGSLSAVADSLLTEPPFDPSSRFRGAMRSTP